MYVPVYGYKVKKDKKLMVVVMFGIGAYKKERGFKMSKSKDALKKFSQRSKFLKLRDGETVEITFLSAEVVANKFDKDKESVRYHVKLDGQDKLLESGSNSLCDQMREFEENDVLRITRTGKLTETKYTVIKVA